MLCNRFWLGGLFLLVVVSCTLGQEISRPKRAKLPKWETFPSDVFFRDAFQEGLIGTRPAKLGGVSPWGSPTRTQKTEASNAAGVAWNRLVAPETLEDEVKSLHLAVQKTVTTPSQFSGGGYQDVRRQFTELATLFAVISEFDGKVRWKQESPLARDLFARAAANAKVTSIQAFNEAKQRKIDLEELVRGGTLTSSTPTEGKNNWERICDRAPLMERFTACFDEGIVIWSANPNSFKQNLNNLKREAELLRVFAAVLTQAGMEDTGDADYEAYCRQLGKAAEQVLNAVESNDPAAAREAASEVGKTCLQCHDGYRA